MSQQVHQSMQTFQIILQEVRNEAPGVKSFLFKYDKATLQYKPGQIVLVFPEDGNPNLRHAFSIASSPTEDTLMISTKIRADSQYKDRLNTLRMGDTVSIMGPAGQFGFPDQPVEQIVLLGGGIGITPFRSLVKYATDNKSQTKITLFYSNGTPEDIVYKQEWKEYEGENPHFTAIHTITKPSESTSGWKGHRGRIDKEMIRRYIERPEKAFYLVCGPPSLVTDLTRVLTEMGISATQIRTENFRGYAD